MPAFAPLETVRARCPDLSIPAAAFQAAVSRLTDEPSVDDLVEIGISVACASGDRRALERFERIYFGSARRAASKILRDTDMVEEVMQGLRQRLFVPRDDSPAAVVLAAGRGSLSTFVRVCAVRLSLNLLRGERRRSSRNASVGQDSLGDAFDDPELRLGRNVSTALLKEAFEHAIAQLTAKQRNLLRHQLLDHLTLDQLASRYRAHRRTVARWLAGAREAVVSGTRAEVVRRLGSAQSPENLSDLVHSRLELSITRVLGRHSATQTPVST